MKIQVLSRKEIKKLYYKDVNFLNNNYIISIYSSSSCVTERECYSPFPDHKNVLKLNFDDVVEKSVYSEDMINKLLFFSEEQAVTIHKFIEKIKEEKMIYVHCDAGVSRSGAVGYILNEWFNKYLTNNEEDNKYFLWKNAHIMPNPLVLRLLKNELFEINYNDIFVNEDREMR